jgi:hypothetical protein
VRRLAQTGVGHTATPRRLVLPRSGRSARSWRGRELTAAGNLCLLLLFLAWPDRPHARGPSSRRAVNPLGRGMVCRRGGFVHCFPPGVIAVLSLALCINPSSPPRNVLQFQAYDQHNHYFIQSTSDALEYRFRTEVLPASDLSFASASLEDHSTEEGLHAVNSCPQPVIDLQSIDNTQLSPSSTTRPELDRRALRAGKLSPVGPVQSALALPTTQDQSIGPHSSLLMLTCIAEIGITQHQHIASILHPSTHHILHHG